MSVFRTIALSAALLPSLALAQESTEENDKTTSESVEETAPESVEEPAAEEPAPVAAPAAEAPAAEPAPETRSEPLRPPQEPEGDSDVYNAAYVGRDQDDRRSTLETQDKQFQINAFFETEYHEYNNLDFRALDESTDQAILDSDDRGRFAFTGAALELGYKPDQNTRFVLGVSYRGLWGGHQIGNVNRFGGFLFFTSLYAEWSPRTAVYQPMVRIGRQRFDLGGMGGAREFIYGNIIDAVRVDFPLGKVGRLVTLPLEVVGLSVSDENEISFINYVGQSQFQMFGFRGDKMTFRSGGEFIINPEAVPELDVRAYGFYTHVGAAGTGSDLSYQGRLGNFTDRDWTVNYGVRAAYTIIGKITPFAEFAGSAGIDRKERVARDVDTNGFAWSAGVIARKAKPSLKEFGYSVQARYFEAMGGAYGPDGLQYSHGYVGMRGRKVGGLIANRFLGWHPSAYVGVQGVYDRPNDARRRSGTRVIEARGTFEFPGPVSLSAGYWFMQDTSLTYLNPDDLDTITPPFGYSRREFEAQERFGKVLGHEINLGLGLTVSSSLSIYTQGAVLLPGEFYSIEVARVAGSQLGSSDPQPAWDVTAGARMRF